MKYEVTQDIGGYEKGMVLTTDKDGRIALRMDRKLGHDAANVNPVYLPWLKPIVEKTREELEAENKKLKESARELLDKLLEVESQYRDSGSDLGLGKHIAYGFALEYGNRVFMGLL